MGTPPPEAAALLGTDVEGRPTLMPSNEGGLVASRHEEALCDALSDGADRAGRGLVARRDVYDALEELDDQLSRRRFLLGERLTVPDVHLACCLFRWDAACRDAFDLGDGRVLRGYDDDGRPLPGMSDDDGVVIGASGQQYPDALPLNRDEQWRLLEKGEEAATFARDHFGDVTFEDLEGQPYPRLFLTHLFGTDLLPARFLGTELAEPCPNPFGSSFDWVRAQESVADLLVAQAQHFGRTRPRVLCTIINNNNSYLFLMINEFIFLLAILVWYALMLRTFLSCVRPPPERLPGGERDRRAPD